MPVTLPVIRLAGLPDFNAEGQDTFAIEDLTNWWNTAPPTPVMVSNGGGAGSVATGDWLATEEFLTLSGWVRVPPDQQETWRRQLLAALPSSREVALTYVGNGWDVDKQMFVRRYDRPTITKGHFSLYFSFALVAPDPYKYGLTPVGGQTGIYTGEKWFRSYALPLPWSTAYAPPLPWRRSYQQTVPTGPLPVSTLIDSAGDVASQRLTVAVTGPVAAGDWWLVNESTGDRLWADVTIAAGQTLTFDCRAKTALLNGLDIGHLVFGNWLTLAPGGNTYRLRSGTQTDAYATIDALEAYL